MREFERECAWCGNLFKTTKAHKRFCDLADNSCSKEYAKALLKKVPNGEFTQIMTCSVCGEPFMREHQKQICCCADCKIEHHKRITKEFYHKNREKIRKEQNDKKRAKKESVKKTKETRKKKVCIDWEDGIHYGQNHRVEVRVRIPDNMRTKLHRAGDKA